MKLNEKKRKKGKKNRKKIGKHLEKNYKIITEKFHFFTFFWDISFPRPIKSLPAKIWGV
jgi:hypothetical protein